MSPFKIILGAVFRTQKSAAFSSPFITEVTSQLLVTTELTIPITHDIANNLCYLATFNSAYGLVPVTWTIIDREKSSMTFKNIIPNTLYFPVVFQEQQFKTVGDPFIIHTVGTASEMQLFKNERTGSQSMLLTRKFPEKVHLQESAKRLIGANVVAYNNPEEKKDTLFVLDYIPRPQIQQVSLNNSKAYRYYELYPKDEKFFNNGFSEVSFYTDKKFGYSNTVDADALPQTSASDNNDQNNLVRVLDRSWAETRKVKVYDGNMETAQEERVVNFHLQTPQVLTHLRFAPLNANNGIVPRNIYQLKYWDGNVWMDFEGPKQAEKHYLTFDHVPISSLYWLKNISGGREELPFHFDEKGNQVFIYSVGE